MEKRDDTLIEQIGTFGGVEQAIEKMFGTGSLATSPIQSIDGDDPMETDTPEIASAANGEPQTAASLSLHRLALKFFDGGDRGRAQRLAITHGDRLRWVPERENWFEYRHGVWIPSNKTSESFAVHEMREAVRRHEVSYWTERADSKDKNSFEAKRLKAAQEVVNKLNDHTPVVRTLRMAATMPDFAVTAHQFNTHGHMFNFRNGTLDTRTMDFHEHRHLDYLTKQSPVDYDPKAPTPTTWLRFMDEVTDGDEALQEYLQKVWGLVLSAELMHREQAMFVHTGAGSNGKSTAFGVLTAILGGSDKSCTDGSWVHTTYVSVLSPETFMQSRRPGDGSGPTPHLLAMNGTRMNLVNELPIGGRWNESLVKSITGKDPIAARHMYSELVKQINVEGLLHFLTNHVPNIDAANFAMMRRLRMIPWSVRFDEQKMDPDLPQKLMAEQTGIVQWLVEGLRMYKADKANGTNPRDLRHAPPAVTNCMQAFLKSIDVVEQFLTDEVKVTNEPKNRIPTSDLYNAFKDWAHSSGYSSPPLTRRGFTEKMKSKGFVMGHGRTGDFFEGMQLNNFF